MSSGTPRLGQIEPRERVGAQTGRKYEYQYERTARAALNLLADGVTHICVYCDWHDDYVAEIGSPPTRYIFHQVKARNSSQGPWKFSELFGVLKKKTGKPSKTPPTITMDAIIPLMLLHYKNFGNSCAGLAFVTNAGLDPGLSDFLQTIRDANNESDLSGETKNAFQHMARGYMATDPALTATPAELFTWLRCRIQVSTDQGNLEDQNAALSELADVVVDYSEIDLLHLTYARHLS